MSGATSSYVGRIIGAGRTASGTLALAYRVSSRSFPNRDAERHGDTVRIVPRAGSADASSDSPYIAYECLLWNERYAVASNGTQTRPIFERLKAGNSVRDALVAVLAGLDREFDAHDTPRICAVVDRASDIAYLGSVCADALSVAPIAIKPGQMAYISTYGGPLPAAGQIDTAFSAATAAQTCDHVIAGSVFSQFDKPVCSTALLAGSNQLDVAVHNP